ncbi:MAG: hypothetical protein QF903_12880 [Planctomycetota bacterium]|jgi:hypothetical protein|nr:hypothetical protein [Planctomycetota bacterium]MDP6761917.1 hypothetical protein [Planctomycetota bacterium]MDP6990357.1 hypothetical protein [Planctomycetota bacterium]
MKTLDTLLLLALPASGKSEVRRYLASLTEEQCRDSFGLGPTVQLDDFPYVHFMRRVDGVLEQAGQARLFYDSDESSFSDPRDWGTLIELINQDREVLTATEAPSPAAAAAHLFARIDAAGAELGIPARIAALATDVRAAASDALEGEAREFLAELEAARVADLSDKTIVVEFARGGPQGAEMPLPPPLGYRHSLACLSDELLERAVILYVWVTPEESRRRNDARTDPDDPGSILHHGVPLQVMLGDYGTDDMGWLEESSDRERCVKVETRGRTFHVPVARFDNREDKTSFLRDDPSDWDPAAVAAVHEGLRDAIERARAAAGVG